MSRRWPPGTAKIHEGCGGLVRWVEAVKQPGVRWTGHCLKCEAEPLTIEDIVPVRPERDLEPIEVVNQTSTQTLAELQWDDEADWDENQARLRELIA